MTIIMLIQTIMSVKLEVNQLKALQSGQIVEQVLHVLQNHATRSKYLHLIVFLGKVTGKHVGEALYIR